MFKKKFDKKVSEYKGRIDLKNTLLIGAQHVLPSTAYLLNSLVEIGLKPENIYLLGKVYSSCALSKVQMKNIGINVSELSFSYNSHQPYDIQYSRHIKRFIADIINSVQFENFSRIIALDDGGILLKEISDLNITHKNLVGIEQTSSGFHLIKTVSTTFPIINIARSDVKLTHESPLIAKIALDALQIHLKRLKIRPKNALVLGNGPIGSNIAKLLKKTFYNVDVFDIDSSISTLDSSCFDKHLKSYDIIFGCSGKTSLSFEKHPLLKKDAILVSCSSSDREFEAYKYRLLCSPSCHPHTDYKIKNIHLLNSGFPITFNGHTDINDPECMYLTRTLILMGIAQACQSYSKQTSLVNLCNNTQFFRTY